MQKLRTLDYKLVQYQFVRPHNCDENESFSTMVREEIKNGWEPLGGVVIITNEYDDRIFTQAMVITGVNN